MKCKWREKNINDEEENHEHEWTIANKMREQKVNGVEDDDDDDEKEEEEGGGEVKEWKLHNWMKNKWWNYLCDCEIFVCFSNNSRNAWGVIRLININMVTNDVFLYIYTYICSIDRTYL